MDHTPQGMVRGKLIARGGQVAARDTADIAPLARVRRALADVASSVLGICRRCGVRLEPEQPLESPDLNWCSHCARPNAK